MSSACRRSSGASRVGATEARGDGHCATSPAWVRRGHTRDLARVAPAALRARARVSLSHTRWLGRGCVRAVALARRPFVTCRPVSGAVRLAWGHGGSMIFDAKRSHPPVLPHPGRAQPMSWPISGRPGAVGSSGPSSQGATAIRDGGAMCHRCPSRPDRDARIQSRPGRRTTTTTTGSP